MTHAPDIRKSDLRACSPPLAPGRGAVFTCWGLCATPKHGLSASVSDSVHVRRSEIAGDGRSADLASDCARPRCAAAAPCESARPSPSPRATETGPRCLSQKAFMPVGDETLRSRGFLFRKDSSSTLATVTRPNKRKGPGLTGAAENALPRLSSGTCMPGGDNRNN